MDLFIDGWSKAPKQIIRPCFHLHRHPIRIVGLSLLANRTTQAPVGVALCMGAGVVTPTAYSERSS